MIRQLAPSDPEILHRAALVKMESKRFAEALPLLEQALRVAPYYRDAIQLRADAHYEIGLLARSGGELDEALARFERSLEAYPKHLESLSARAQVLIELRRFEAAEEALRLLLAEIDETPQLLMAYGDVLFRNGKAAEARANWEAALRATGRDVQFSQLREGLRARLDSLRRGGND